MLNSAHSDQPRMPFVVGFVCMCVVVLVLRVLIVVHINALLLEAVKTLLVSSRVCHEKVTTPRPARSFTWHCWTGRGSLTPRPTPQGGCETCITALINSGQRGAKHSPFKIWVSVLT